MARSHRSPGEEMRETSAEGGTGFGAISAEGSGQGDPGEEGCQGGDQAGAEARRQVGHGRLDEDRALVTEEGGYGNGERSWRRGALFQMESCGREAGRLLGRLMAWADLPYHLPCEPLYAICSDLRDKQSGASLRFRISHRLLLNLRRRYESELQRIMPSDRPSCFHRLFSSGFFWRTMITRLSVFSTGGYPPWRIDLAVARRRNSKEL